MAGIYRNDGAPWSRPDGTTIRKGDEFVPTEDERRRRAYKLTYLRPSDEEPPEPNEAPPADRKDLGDYEIGGGWYLIGGEKVQGRAEASKRLNEMEAAGG